VLHGCDDLTHDGEVGVRERVQGLGDGALDAVLDGDDAAFGAPSSTASTIPRTDSENAMSPSSATASAARWEYVPVGPSVTVCMPPW